MMRILAGKLNLYLNPQSNSFSSNILKFFSNKNFDDDYMSEKNVTQLSGPILSRKHQKIMFKEMSSFSGGGNVSANPHLLKILENNRKWVAETKEKDPDFFVALGKQQKPKYLYFGCSDSRVPANQILGLG